MDPLKSFSFRVSSTLADFEATPLFTSQTPAAAEATLKRWAQQQQQQPASCPFNDVYAALTGSPAAALASLLARSLSAVALESTRLLQAGKAPTDGDPRVVVAQLNTFKLALFFLCHLNRKIEQVTAAPTIKEKGRKGGSQAGDAACQHLQLKHDIMRNLRALYELLLTKAVLPSAHELKAAEQLLRSTAIGCLVQPPQHAGKASKAVEEALRRSCTGILVKALSCRAGLSANPAMQATRDMLAVAAQPKQQAQALQDVAFIISQLLHQEPREGVSLLAHFMDRAGELQSRSQEGAAAQLDSVLAVLLALVSGDPQGTAARAVLLYAKELALVLQSPRSSSRRLVIDIFSSSMQNCGAQLPDAGQHAGSLVLGVMLGALSDKDAGLRAKALGSLEKHLDALVALGPGAVGPDRHADLVAQALAARLCDKSIAVRKKALQLLSTLLDQDLPAVWHEALSSWVLPVATQLLNVTPDSELSYGEEGSQVLCRGVLAMAGHSSSASALHSLLRLSLASASAAAQSQIHAAIAGILLWGPSAPSQRTGQQEQARQLSVQQHAAALAAMLQGCGRADMGRLAAALHSCCQEKGSKGRRAAARRSALVQACYVRLHELRQELAGMEAGLQRSGGSGDLEAARASNAGRLEELCGILRGLCTLGPISGDPQTAAASEAQMLLSLVHQMLQALPWEHLGGRPIMAGAEQHPVVTLLDQQAGGPKLPSHNCGTGAIVSLQQQTLLWALKCLARALQQPQDGQPEAAAVAASSQPSEAFMARLCAGILPAIAGLMVSRVDDATRAAGLEVLKNMPDPEAASLSLLGYLSRAITAKDAPAPLAADSHAGDAPVFAFDEELGIQRPGRREAGQWEPAGRECAMVGMLQLLAAMAANYEQEKARFKQQLRAEGAGPAAAASPLDSPAGSEANAPGKQGQGFDYMLAEDEAQKHEAAAQRFLDELLAAGNSPPACYLPLLERLLLEEQAPEAVQVAAVRCLGKVLGLSQAVCTAHLPMLESILASSRSVAVKAAAVSVLADVVDAFPSTFGGKLGLVGRLAVQGGGSAALRQQAAAAYARLLLQNKLKLQGMLAVVVSILRRALSHLLQAAGPKERARIALDLFHQTPLPHRAAVIQALSSGLLSAGDLRSDLLVGQAVRAFWAAAAADSSSATAAACLLSRLRPSLKVLTFFKTYIEAWGSRQPLPPEVLQHLRAFVGNCTASSSSAGVADGNAGTDGGGPATSAAPKRKRPVPAPSKKQGASAEGLRQQVVNLLSRMGAPGLKGGNASSVPARSALTQVPSSHQG